MYEIDSEDPMSWIVTTLGWLRAEAERASFSNRLKRTGSEAKASGRTLIATSRFRR